LAAILFGGVAVILEASLLAATDCGADDSRLAMIMLYIFYLKVLVN
jgi:hypothetical protein